MAPPVVPVNDGANVVRLAVVMPESTEACVAVADPPNWFQSNRQPEHNMLPTSKMMARPVDRTVMRDLPPFVIR